MEEEEMAGRLDGSEARDGTGAPEDVDSPEERTAAEERIVALRRGPDEQNGEPLTEMRERAVSAEAEVARLRAELAAATDAASAYDADLRVLRSELVAADERVGGATAKYRELARRAEPDLPPDVIAGDSIEAIDAAIAAARGIADRVRERIERQALAMRTPAGAPARGGIDVSRLSPEQKIRLGLEQRA